MKNSDNPSPAPEQREAALFTAALERPAAERAAFLDGACLGDASLRQRLEALLAVADAEDSFPEPAEPVRTIKLDIADAPDESIGQKIGRYKILERVGEGGCGVVYVAEQTEPVRRRVALKVIKLGMDTKQVVARFEAERQALAMMDHPNIAKVLDAGTTDVGRPFFVMELVRGIRITDYCDQAQLSTKDRLDLFIQVCHAIQHAHQKGIIHRDIKPSNILVTLHDGVPVPKVIDFGIAKATEGRLTDATVYTQLHQFIGTPAYMSPEQAEMSGLDIDTRSDIYSLGVLLYELLAGSTPFDGKELMSLGIDAMRKVIREKEPARPSTKLATLQGEALTTTAKSRSVEISKLANLLRGDLDWIVMKCLEKDRSRRYDTANGLAADIKRHLGNEPVTARPPSAAYQFQKLFRRNKLAFTAATAVFAALCLGIIATTLQSVRATRAKHEAVAARQEAVTNEQKAEAAQASETKLREQAQAEEFAARQRAYASDMNVAKQALDGNNLGRALDLLNRQRPQPGQKDLRGWEWRYLWQQTRSDALFTLDQESSEIISLTASPDGNWLAVGARQQDGLSVWDLRTRQEVVRLAKHENYIFTAFSPTEPLLAFASSTMLASGQSRTALRLWNTVTRQIVAEIPLDTGCFGLAFAKDGKTLVTSTAGKEGVLTLWRMPDGNKLASYPIQQNWIDPGTGFAATADLGLVAFGLLRNQIAVMDVHTGKELWSAVASKEFITGLAFSPDGKTLASAAGFAESDIRLWDVATGQQIGQLKGHSSWVSSLVFWPDGKKLASSCADQTIRIWDVPNQKCLQVLHGHRQEVWRLTFLPDAKTLVSGAKDGTVCLWDTSVTRLRQPHLSINVPKSLANWSFTPDSRSVLTVNQPGQVSRWSGSDFQRQETLSGLGEAVTTNADSFMFYQFSLDGRFLAAGSTNGVLQVWDLVNQVPGRRWTNTTDVVGPIAFLANGTKLLTFSVSDNLLHEWDLQTGLEIQSWQAPSQFTVAALTPDERHCLAIGYGGDVVARNLLDQSPSKVDLEIREAVHVGYSPNGKLFAVASDLGYARVWDTATWKPVATLAGILNGANTVGFSADGKRLAIASVNREAVKLWDTESWQEVFTLEGQGTGVQGAFFSLDGNKLVWGNQNALYLWRAPSWDEIHAAEANEKAESKQP